jgi:hypothetical protein
MGNRGSGLLEFCAVDTAAVLPPIDNHDVEVGVGLSMGRQEAVTYGIRDITGNGKTLFLDRFHVISELLMVWS